MYGPVWEFRSSFTGFPAAFNTSSRLFPLIRFSLTATHSDNDLKSYADAGATHRFVLKMSEREINVPVW
jgi:hypothetical protein